MREHKFKGDSSTYRKFVTDLMIAIGRLDGMLAKALKYMLTDRKADSASTGVAEKIWSATIHGGVEIEIYNRNRYESFGLISSLVTNEAKQIATSMIEDGDESQACGFRLLW